MAAITVAARRAGPLCRYAAGGPTTCRDDAELVAYLRRLETLLDRWRCARLQRSACGLASAPPALPLGTFTRRFVVWLETHPERANEPLDWVVGSALDELADDTVGGQPVPHPAAALGTATPVTAATRTPRRSHRG